MRPRYSLKRGGWYRDPDGRSGRFVEIFNAWEWDHGREKCRPWAILEEANGTRFTVDIATLLQLDDAELVDE